MINQMKIERSLHRYTRWVSCIVGVISMTPLAMADSPTAFHPLMQHLEAELTYSMENLVAADGTKPYYMAYTVYDEQTLVMTATLGSLAQDQLDRKRNLNTDIRVGDYKLDNTHQLRGGGASHARGGGNIPLALDDEVDSIRHTLWLHTDRTFKRAVKRLDHIRTNRKVKVEEDDLSNDFSKETMHTYAQKPVTIEIDRADWAKRLRKISAIGRQYPAIYGSSITLGVYAGTRYLVSSEGSRLQTTQRRFRITMSAATKADDGMDLSQFSDFNAALEASLPDDVTIEAAFRKVIEQVLALREAPLAEPYSGPAILVNRASAVFFHEIFGHRIEGHRQKDVNEGQTFRRKVNEQVLPTFLSVYDDPTLAKMGDIDLRGYYRFDDEGVEAKRAVLIEHGILQQFLMSRAPLDGFPNSNGHGRRQPGFASISRQANLIVESTKQVPYERLRELLVEQCKAQDKPYGLLFKDISGGFTTTSRSGPQSFKVLPIIVYKVFTDGKPDELIRGADIVGTPLASFEKITYTGDDPAVFNGSCGAESGWVPVSAVSPSILVSTIEIEKRTRNQSRPPILTSPLAKVADSENH